MVAECARSCCSQQTIGMLSAVSFGSIVVSVAAVVLPVLAAKAVLEGKVKPQLRSAMRRHRVGSRGYRPGTFEYNFHMHGNGREQVPRWLR